VDGGDEATPDLTVDVVTDSEDECGTEMRRLRE